jgi:hypothetical protein
MRFFGGSATTSGKSSSIFSRPLVDLQQTIELASD